MNWIDCRRCSRCEQRFAVRAPDWPAATQVVLLTTHPSRTEQACNHDAPVIARLKERVCAALGFREDEVVSDHLVACGIGDPHPGEVAACSQRFLEQAAKPAVVVLLGKKAAALARLAGLLDQTRWHPVGMEPVPAIVAVDDDHVIAELAALMGRPAAAQAEPSRAELSLLAKDLYGVLGPCEGRSLKKPGRDWVRDTARCLQEADVTHHLDGRCWVAPFRPRRPWPFVVLDVDLHDALQELHFDTTMQGLRELLPKSLVVQSSESGGRHVYVRLPEDTRYDNAALWMRAFLLLHDQRFAEVRAGDQRVRAELVEVKNHPPRLPFGIGSVIPGSALPLHDQLRAFLTWVRSDDTSDYVRAAEQARKALQVPQRWNYGARKKLNAWVLEQEAGVIEKGVKVSPGDPWFGIHQNLPKYLQHVVGAGIPAHGTRTFWTRALITELAEHVDEATAQELLEYWLRERPHQSTDIAEDLDRVIKEARAKVADHYDRLHGVPVRIWSQIELSVRQALEDARLHGKAKYPKLKDPQNLKEEQVLATAFFIARGFFEGGVHQRQVPEREFAEFAGKNRAHDVQEVLSWSSGWLEFNRDAVREEAAREYELTLWPAFPGEEALVVPPFPLPPRSKAR